MSVVLVVCVAVSLIACDGEKKESLRASVDDKTVEITTQYGVLLFPEALLENIKHKEIAEEHVVMEIFSMFCNAGEREVFRIYYGDPNMGAFLGYLNTKEKEIPVTYTLTEYTDGAFDEEDHILYCNIMNSFGVVLNSIFDDERFSEKRQTELIAEREVNLRYWTVTLPENVECEETAENEPYSVNFYGQVSGERVKLYTISLGLQGDESRLGWFTIDCVQQPVTIETYYESGNYEAWPEEDRMVVFEMMDTINNVISVITEDKNFSETLPEE